MFAGFRCALFAFVLIVCFSALPMRADIIPIFGTGLDASGSLLAGGLADPHYKVLGGLQAVVLSSANHAWDWQPNLSNAQWIAERDQAFYVPSVVYETTFDLTGLDPATAVITGFWTADDEMTVALNANIIGSVPYGSWGGLQPFTIAGGFVPGMNSLQFSAPSDLAWDGIFVQITSATAAPVPEPGSIVLLATVAGLCAAALRKRLPRP